MARVRFRSVWMVALNLLLQKSINLSQFVNLTISSQNLIVVFFNLNGNVIYADIIYFI